MDVDLIVLINQIPATTFIDYLGVVMGVLAGALFAIERKLDVVGVVSLGIITGFGGGIIRDLLLQDQGIFFMEHPIVILASIFICIAMSTGMPVSLSSVIVTTISPFSERCYQT